jgi:hypothetical protein
MQAELEQHLATEESPNRKNGTTCKTMKIPTGEFELKTPRDRANTFEPQIVKKHQTHLTYELERKVIALFALGNSYQDIRSHIIDMCDISLSNSTINAVTDKHLPELQAWRERELDAIYPIVWLDAIHYTTNPKWESRGLLPRAFMMAILPRCPGFITLPPCRASGVSCPPQFSALIRRGVAVILLLLCIKGFEVIAKTPFLGP